MKSILLTILTFITLSTTLHAQPRNTHYITNQSPLYAQPYTALPLGDIQPKGWIRKIPRAQCDFSPSIAQFPVVDAHQR